MQNIKFIEDIINSINETFNSLDNIHNETRIIKTRNKQLSINDTIKYIFKYSQINKTKDDVIDDLKNKNIFGHQTSFDRKLKNITDKFFEKLFENVKDIFYNNINNFDNITNKLNEDYKNLYDQNNNIIHLSADGSFNKKIVNNELYTCLNLFVYDDINKIPIDILCNNNDYFTNNKNNKSNKNHETTILKDYILNNKDKLNNIIIVLDRLYSSYKLLNFLYKYNVKYVIRGKENLDILNEHKKDKINQPFLNDPNFHIVKETYKSTKVIRTSNNVSKTITVNSNYNILTNLDKKYYNDKNVLNIYNSRWNIEVFIKHTKSNFKFDLFKINDDQINKIKLIDLIIFTLNKLFIYIYLFIKDNDNNNFFKVKNRRINKDLLDMRYKKNKEKIAYYESHNEHTFRVVMSKLLKGFYKELIYDLIDGKLTIDSILNFGDKYIQIIKNDKNRTFERKSLVPFTKWYVKMYHKIYEYEKIITAIKTNTMNNLNKNLKTKANQLKEQIIELYKT